MTQVVDTLGGRVEAITSRLLLAALDTAASHAHQSIPHLMPLQGCADVLKRLFANIDAAWRQVRATAERFKDLDRSG